MITTIIIQEYYKLFENDYRGEHTAPDKESGSPLYDVTNEYGEDIYSSNALKYYGTGSSYDMESINIIKSCRNKPNTLVKIYRAVPNINKETQDKIKTLKEILAYYNKFDFFPMRKSYSKLAKIVDLYSEPYINDDGSYKEEFDYKEIQLKIYDAIFKDIVNNEKNLKPLKINEGDWVTLSLSYAKEHGSSNLKGNKILQKTVRAKDIYNNGDIHEWGYDPT